MSIPGDRGQIRALRNPQPGLLSNFARIDRDRQAAYRLQEEFIKSMLDAMSEKDRARISGRFGACIPAEQLEKLLDGAR